MENLIWPIGIMAVLFMCAFAIKKAVRSMTTISHNEINNLAIGDKVTVKADFMEYYTGRIVFLNRSSGHGILKPKDHSPVDFHVSQIRSLL